MTGVDGKYGVRTRWGAMVHATKDRQPGSAAISLVGSSPVVFTRDRFVLIADGPQTQELTFLPLPGSVHLYLNGLEQDEGTDWSAEEQTVSLLLPADVRAGDLVDVRYASASDDPQPVAEGYTTGSATFEYNGTDGSDGAEQLLVVPAGVTQMLAKLWGAQGGRSGTNINPGGLGGYLEVVLDVVAGETLKIRSGGSRAPSEPGAGNPGYNGGGAGGHGGSAGGGASDIRRGAVVLAIAAGGGGAGDSGSGPATGAGGAGGGAVGQAGGAGAAGFGTGGGPGIAIAGGAAGAPTATSGTAGAAGQGGVGGHDADFGDYGGGGGGGGHFGGGGGGRGSTGHPFDLPPGGGAGGGGGGSSWTSGTEVANVEGARSGHGRVVITW